MNLNNFTIFIDPPAAKELKKLHKKQPAFTNLLIKNIDSLASHPYSGKPLKGDRKGCYSLRRGVYRIIVMGQSLGESVAAGFSLRNVVDDNAT